MDSCSTKDCPWPDDPDIHRAWCLSIPNVQHMGASHQHHPKKGMGGNNPDSKIVAILCLYCHDRIDNGDWNNYMLVYPALGTRAYVITDRHGLLLARRDLDDGSPDTQGEGSVGVGVVRDTDDTASVLDAVAPRVQVLSADRGGVNTEPEGRIEPHLPGCDCGPERYCNPAYDKVRDEWLRDFYAPREERLDEKTLHPTGYGNGDVVRPDDGQAVPLDAEEGGRRLREVPGVEAAVQVQSLEQWGEAFVTVVQQRAALSLTLALSLDYGLERWGEDIWQYVTESGLQRRTCENVISVVRAFPPGLLTHRAVRLDWDVIREIAPVYRRDAEEGERLLVQADAENLSTEEVQARKRLLRGLPEPEYTYCSECGARIRS